MDLSPEARLGLRSPRRFGRTVALDEGSSLGLDAGRCLSLFLEACRRQLALPARIHKRTTDLLRVEGFLLSRQALKLAVAPNPSNSTEVAPVGWKKKDSQVVCQVNEDGEDSRVQKGSLPARNVKHAEEKACRIDVSVFDPGAVIMQELE